MQSLSLLCACGWCWQWLGNLEGEKVFTLYHPSMRPYIERAENDWADLRNPIDAEAFPRFRKAVPAQTKLKAGEIIYIPRRWPCALFCPLASSSSFCASRFL